MGFRCGFCLLAMYTSMFIWLYFGLYCKCFVGCYFRWIDCFVDVVVACCFGVSIMIGCFSCLLVDFG